MSAKFNPQDKNWLNSMLYQGHVNQLEEALMMSAFDQETDMDITEAEKLMTKSKFLRRVCLYKRLVFPLELMLIFLLLGTTKAKDHVRLTRIYKKFHQKRIGLEEFRKQLQLFYKESPLL